jgi:hypothetical protein
MKTLLELLLLNACVSIYTAAVSASILLKSNTVDTKHDMLVWNMCLQILTWPERLLSAIS